MKQILLTQGKFALVDDEDYERLNQHKWCAYKSRGLWYAMSNIKIEGKYRHIKMHRFILDIQLGDKREVDHINHNTLDNRRSNIRICSHSENLKNRVKGRGTSSFLGVHKEKNKKKWRSLINVEGRDLHLGYFIFEELAALAYDFAAMKYHREFASFNFN